MNNTGITFYGLDKETLDDSVVDTLRQQMKEPPLNYFRGDLMQEMLKEKSKDIRLSLIGITTL